MMLAQADALIRKCSVFALGFARVNDAQLVLLSHPKAIDAYCARVQAAVKGRYLYVEHTLTPSGDFVEIRGAVRRGFALKHGEHAWFGYTEAGNGTPGYVWMGNSTDFDRLLSSMRV